MSDNDENAEYGEFEQFEQEYQDDAEFAEDDGELSEADYDDYQDEEEDDVVDDDVDSYLNQQGGVWKDKERVGKGTNIRGMEQLTTTMSDNNKTYSNKFDKSPDVIFQDQIRRYQIEYSLDFQVVTEAEFLIHKMNRFDLRNPLAIVLALSVLSPKKGGGTEIDRTKLAKLSVEKTYGHSSDVSTKYSVIQRATSDKNVSLFDVLRYCRFIIPLYNQE